MMQSVLRGHIPLSLALISALTILPPGLARAKTGAADEAELKFQLATQAYLAKDFLRALEHFMASNRLVPNRNVVYNIARTFEQLQRYPDAHRYYTDALEGEVDEATKKEIEAAITRISPRVAVLRVATTPPGATIFLNRRDLGSVGTAPRALGLPAGTYKVLVDLDGYEPAESQVITASLGSENKVELRLTRVVGTLAISGSAGAAAFVDDADVPACVVPCQLELGPGLHSVSLRREGFEAATKQVTIIARQEAHLEAELAPLTGSLVVNADERDALVEIDGRPAGFTPAVIPNVPVGTRRVRVSLRGYRPLERTVEVQPSTQTELLELELIPQQEITAASRFTETAEDAPASISVISGNELRAFAYPTIAEALRGTRGISVSWDGAYSSVGVRGLGAPGDYGNRLLVLGDGASLNDNIISSSYVGYDARADLGDLDHIEVVRGPGSILYGTGAVSGVVNLVTQSHDAPSRVHGSIGTAEDGVAQGRAGFNLHLSDNAGLWASVSGARSGGISMVFEDSEDGLGPRQADQVGAFRAGTVAGTAWWGPVSIQGLYSMRDAKQPFGSFGFRFNDPGSRYIDRRSLVEAKLDTALSQAVELMTRAHLNLYDFVGDYVYDESKAFETYAGKWVGIEARLALKLLENKLRISLGGELLQHFTATMIGDSQEGDERERYLDERRPFTIGAAYAMLDTHWLRWLRLQAGARLDLYSTFGVTLNPRISAVVQPREGDALKLILGRAFRAPSVYEQYYNDGGLTQVPANSDGAELQPETSYSAELEYLHRLSTDWAVTLAANTSYIQDSMETTGDATEESPLRYVNSSEPVISGGGDLELRREWRQGWMLAAMYGFQLTRYVHLPANSGGESARVINAPEHLASIKGVAPLVPALAVLAVRLTFEAPRRVSLESDEVSKPGFVADIVLSGEAKRYGLSYAAGVYNLLDWEIRLPVGEGWPASTMPQTGRSLRASVTLSY